MNAPSSPLTVVVTYDIVPGREGDHEEWIHRVTGTAARFPGYLGGTVLIPDASTPERRVLVQHFANKVSRRAWEKSEERQRLVRESEEFSAPHYQQATGLETWFALPDVRAIVPPPRWKMLITSFIGVYPLVVVFLGLIAPQVGGWPLLARAALFPGVLLTLMTYVVMPLLTRLLRAWLYPRQPLPPSGSSNARNSSRSTATRSASPSRSRPSICDRPNSTSSTT